MNIRSFENNDLLFLKFLIENPQGFVLNIRKSGKKLTPALHSAWCSRIVSRKKTDREQPFTGQKYRKITSTDLNELLSWAKNNGISETEIQYCSNCHPNDNEFIKIVPGIELIEQHFEAEFQRAKLATAKDVEIELEKLNKLSNKKVIASHVYERNPWAVRKVLEMANGICAACKQPAPFSRKSDGSPFLEVHHVQPLSQRGQDIVQNCQALCPNCHRKAHFG